MPETPDETDPFQDKGEAKQESLPAYRLKVGMTFAAGVLSIVATTALLIMISRGSDPGREQGSKPVGIDATLPPPSTNPEPSAVVSPLATSTAMPSQSRKPSTGPGTPGPGQTHVPEATSTPVVVALNSLSCTPSTVPAGQNTTCRVRLTAPAQSDMTVDLMSGSASLSVPPSVSVSIGSTEVTFDATSASDGTGDVTVTATMGTVTKTDTVTIGPAA
ncbi:hypothetical protein Rhe02_48190 [Rhizocola hellebori]|uniref:Uncharacterized protein n=1 Tax=Rhizocola hellebori TaxID=1392758 RepID=A0A8J3QBE4_9ACTN|nr:hypothetical protein [Rhizocola hellebori]GIH06752.1 hypothetical protein Rhe02_48190 [Rhizocola hellebori]